MLNKLTSSLDFHGQALALRSERQRLIASNIANADTPNYVARDLDFASALKQATGAQQGAAVLKATQPGHIALGGAEAAVQSNLVYATPSQTNLDRNTVDMEHGPRACQLRRQLGPLRSHAAVHQQQRAHDARCHPRRPVMKNDIRSVPAERRAAPKPAGIPSGDRSMYSSDEGLS
jgi:flagellar basal-body rod protein FlgB